MKNSKFRETKGFLGDFLEGFLGGLLDGLGNDENDDD